MKKLTFLATVAASCWMGLCPVRAEDKSAAAATPVSAAVPSASPSQGSVPVVSSAPQKPASAKLDSLGTWFRHWKQALQKTAIEGRYRKMRSTAVAAVRGAGQSLEDPTQPYWKGTWSAKKLAEVSVERKELDAAVDLVLAGKLDEASSAMDSFEKAHPTSTLLQDVQEARQKLAELKGAEAPASGGGLEAAALEKSAEAAESSAEAKPVEPAKAAEPEKAADPAKTSEPTKAAEPAKTETTAPAQSVDTAKPTKATEPAKP